MYFITEKDKLQDFCLHFNALFVTRNIAWEIEFRSPAEDSLCMVIVITILKQPQMTRTTRNELLYEIDTQNHMMSTVKVIIQNVTL